jgi:hypothetical protein
MLAETHGGARPTEVNVHFADMTIEYRTAAGRHAEYLPYHALAVPTVLRERGFRFFFWSNESNEPPHIHVQSGDG